MFRIIFFFFFLSFVSFDLKSQTLIMNEVSNGPAGSQEYVEFVVVNSAATYDCSGATPPCIDIRGWIFDDNSGYHGTSGIAAGAIRFSFDSFWSCIPLGTIIVIYNDADPNVGLPANDLSMSDGNCKIVAPISNATLFEKNTTTPGAAACSYPSTGWVAGGAWSNTALANSSDCARLVNLAGCEVFSVCYGSTDNLNTLIYFSAAGTGNVYYFNGGDPQQQANWTSASASTSQTPGAANNAANQAYINQFNNGCTPITPIVVTATGINAGCTCNGSATASASGSIAGYTYEWFDASFVAIGQTSVTATGLCAGDYHVIATSSIGCTDTAHVTITSSGSTTVVVNAATICAGVSTTLTATPSASGGTFLWAPSGATTNTVSVSPTSNQTYTVTYTLAGCNTTGTGVVTVNPLPIVTSTSTTVCIGQSATITASGADSYVWNTGVTTAGLTINPATTTTTYTVMGTNTATSCTNTAMGIITVNSLPVVASTSITVCSGQSATITASGADSYVWNTGVITAGLTINPATITTTYTVTGTNTTTSCTNTATGVITINSLPVVASTSTTVCSGQSATITASGADSYIWNTGATTAGLTTNPATSTTTYTVTGTNTATSCTNTAIGIITVNITPTVTVNSEIICPSGSATLIANGATTYMWDNASTSASITDSPIVTTTYTVTGTSLGCTSTAVATITVVAVLPVTITSSTICVGQALTLVATGASAFVWNDGSTTSSINVSPVSTTTYSVTGTTGTCSGTGTATITVNELPIVASTSTTVCAGQSATIIASGADTYVWNTGATTAGLTIDPATTSATYTVTGTNTATSCTNTAIGVITVNALPIVSSTSLSICSGQSATITATGADTYVWNTGATTDGLTINPVTTTIYTVTGTNTVTSCTNTASGIITVNTLPIVSSTSITVCSGQSATITASGADTYVWNTGVTTAGLTINPATTTTNYTVTGTNSVTTCSTTAVGIITVNSLPVVASTSTTVCSGQSATITASGADTYLWNGGETSSSITINPATVTTSYSVVGTSTLTTCSSNALGTITVNALPNVVATSTAVCNGQFATLTVSGADSYVWNTGITGASFTIISAVQTTAYTVIGTNTLTACSDTSTGTITVNPIPNIVVNPQIICDGETATITASGATLYNWNTSETTPSIVVAPQTTTIYTVTGTVAGCTATQTVQVVVNTAPAFDFVPNIFAGCPPLCIDFIDIVSPGGLTVSDVVWDFGDGAQTSFNDPTHCYTSSGLYDVSLSLTYSNGCVRSYIKTDYIDVYTMPSAAFTTNIASDPEQIDSDIEFTNLSTNASIYSWNFGDANFSNQIDPFHTYAQEGTYQVTLVATSSNGCIDSTKQDLIIKGMFTFYAPNSFSPNEDDSNEIFLPIGTSWDKENYQLYIFDRWGNMCFSTKDMNEGWNGKANGGKQVAQMDTYVWKVLLKDLYGYKHSYHGVVNIIK